MSGRGRVTRGTARRPAPAPERAPAAAPAPSRLTPADVRALQRTAGNQAVARVLAGSAPARMVQRAPYAQHAAQDAPAPYQPNCMMAVLTWLLASGDLAADGLDAAGQIADAGGPTELIRAMCAEAKQRTQPKKDDQIRVTPGMIVIFAKDDEPSHACFATAADTITGYNQTYWFDGPPAAHSSMTLTGHRWDDKDSFINSAGQRNTLHEISPKDALKVFTKAVKKKEKERKARK